MYVNFVGDEGRGACARPPGSTWERLAAVKARYDPDNLFRRNHNIPPAIDDTEARRPYREVTVSDRTPRR